MNSFYCERNFCKPSSFTVRNARSKPFCAGEGEGQRGGPCITGRVLPWPLRPFHCMPQHGFS